MAPICTPGGGEEVTEPPAPPLPPPQLAMLTVRRKIAATREYAVANIDPVFII
jgi:hypothetical protein